jgi:hypothetical protein
MPAAKTTLLLSLLLLGSATLAALRLRSKEAPLLHAERSFTVHLDAAPGEVFPLFGPIGEREWAPGWDPKMIFPADGFCPEKGSVFTTSDEDGEETWVVTGYDGQNSFISYVAVLPGHVVTGIEVRVQKRGENKSIAEVTHRRTALSARGNHMANALSENAARHAAHWEHAINEALRKRRENAGH